MLQLQHCSVFAYQIKYQQKWCYHYNCYDITKKITVIASQEQLLLHHKNNCYNITRITVITAQEQLL